jgi:hypothetical protein
MRGQIYVSVRDVRTADDANLTVHLMIFYELTSIETMLDQTNDLIGDIVNASRPPPTRPRHARPSYLPTYLLPPSARAHSATPVSPRRSP